MDRQQEGEIHAKLIGATHPISHFQNAVCYIREVLSVGLSKGEGKSGVCLERPQSI